VFDGRHVWVATLLPGEVRNIDASGASVAVVPLASPRAMAFDGTHLWVVNSLSPNPGELVKILVSDAAVMASLPLPATRSVSRATNFTYGWRSRRLRTS
jgi:hypothetical protein